MLSNYTKLHKMIIIVIHMTCKLNFKCSETFIHFTMKKDKMFCHSHKFFCAIGICSYVQYVQMHHVYMCTNMNQLW